MAIQEGIWLGNQKGVLDAQLGYEVLLQTLNDIGYSLANSLNSMAKDRGYSTTDYGFTESEERRKSIGAINRRYQEYGLSIFDEEEPDSRYDVMLQEADNL